MWIPRMGQEVIVDFLEGDPDRPLITGRVYNAEEVVPYTLPDNQTVSTFQSRSSKGGGSANYNELRFEDKKGSEQIFINAEKDMDLRVENDSREYVKNDRHLIVHNKQQELVEADKHGHVKGKHFEKPSTATISLTVNGRPENPDRWQCIAQVGKSLNEKIGQEWVRKLLRRSTSSRHDTDP